ncbi:ABC transporter ATP-binding protein [Tissierella simiarum]|uniref:ABC transporter ATP-binding protein n=1 Tax=Tissierella simiarum TaxID=2841534 RepID=UPI001FEBFBF7|nr:oligopeptide/dipeptide ABC transporter ATP-binding protein [Tissierella simiarum]
MEIISKSYLSLSIIRLYEPTYGDIIFENQKMNNINAKTIRKDMQMIFQDPYGCLNPRMTVAEILGEPLEIFNIAKGEEKRRMVHEALQKVGLSRNSTDRYPHEFSGGQRQRVGIARSLILNPKLVVCDEPISALDVSIQAQIVNMLQDLQDELGLTYLFIAHDLAMVKYISDRIGVMYLGKIVEIAESHELYESPIHPYTKALLSSIPIADPDASAEMERIILEGNVPSPLSPPSGCKFRTRCLCAMDICEKEEPSLKEIEKGHSVACHLTDKKF